MTRVKRGTIANKTRRNVLARAKGFRNSRKNKEIGAHEVLVHAGNSAFAHRKMKKRDFRALFTTRISAALRQLGLASYSKTIHSMKEKGIALDRKVLATLAKDSPEIFERVAKQL
ncbi:MAG TPA: 50S ribosomal protein L20 [Candidatus Paceibacterota bacterium]|nr:50S ribosomal protein L20 [Candidatus Paceibacterota bacterium]